MPDDTGFHIAMPTRDSIARVKAWLVSRSITERAMLAVAAIVVIALLALAINWQVDGRFHQSTDNAYVRADISMISAKVSGYVESVDVADNQNVSRGDVLLRLDQAEYLAAVAEQRANLSRAEAELQSVGAQRQLAASDLARYRPLARRGILSPAGMQQIEARAAEMSGTAAASRASVEASRAALAAAELNLERTMIRAPIDGVVGDRQVRVGQLVQPGAPLMAVVPLHSLYVVANFKETQLTQIRPGQPAEIVVDIDEHTPVHGVVESISPASGAEFSIIPMDTATGNFTKIVQRVPVRIRLNPEEAARLTILRPGLSATVKIDTHP
ncbi:MAG: HlyD family secretion protein [Caulobacterales bacterium]